MSRRLEADRSTTFAVGRREPHQSGTSGPLGIAHGSGTRRSRAAGAVATGWTARASPPVTGGSISVRPTVWPDIDDVDHYGSGIVGPGVQTDQQVVASDGASRLDCETANAWRLLDLRQTPPVDQRQGLDRFG
jgi:hypothetical protein